MVRGIRSALAVALCVCVAGALGAKPSPREQAVQREASVRALARRVEDGAQSREQVAKSLGSVAWAAWGFRSAVATPSKARRQSTWNPGQMFYGASPHNETCRDFDQGAKAIMLQADGSPRQWPEGCGPEVLSELMSSSGGWGDSDYSNSARLIKACAREGPTTTVACGSEGFLAQIWDAVDQYAGRIMDDCYILDGAVNAKSVLRDVAMMKHVGCVKDGDNLCIGKHVSCVRAGDNLCYPKAMQFLSDYSPIRDSMTMGPATPSMEMYEQGEANRRSFCDGCIGKLLESAPGIATIEPTMTSGLLLMDLSCDREGGRFCFPEVLAWRLSMDLKINDELGAVCNNACLLRGAAKFKAMEAANNDMMEQYPPYSSSNTSRSTSRSHSRSQSRSQSSSSSGQSSRALSTSSSSGSTPPDGTPPGTMGNDTNYYPPDGTPPPGGYWDANGTYYPPPDGTPWPQGYWDNGTYYPYPPTGTPYPPPPPYPEVPPGGGSGGMPGFVNFFDPARVGQMGAACAVNDKSGDRCSEVLKNVTAMETYYNVSMACAGMPLDPQYPREMFPIAPSCDNPQCAAEISKLTQKMGCCLPQFFNAMNDTDVPFIAWFTAQSSACGIAPPTQGCQSQYNFEICSNVANIRFSQASMEPEALVDAMCGQEMPSQIGISPAQCRLSAQGISAYPTQGPDGASVEGTRACFSVEVDAPAVARTIYSSMQRAGVPVLAASAAPPEWKFFPLETIFADFEIVSGPPEAELPPPPTFNPDYRDWVCPLWGWEAVAWHGQAWGAGSVQVGGMGRSATPSVDQWVCLHNFGSCAHHCWVFDEHKRTFASWGPHSVLQLCSRGAPPPSGWNGTQDGSTPYPGSGTPPPTTSSPPTP